ncbi:MAG: carboxypeptidase regulatory-like domain-containing protein [Gemmatimonadetes bacterium]|nr:carboxypeptidase regulatory-like domain-containing protein [Gemmatimonadota bacterium]
MAERALACIAALLAVLAAAAPLRGQILRARLLDAGTDAPIPAAFAILENYAPPGAGTRAAAALSDAQGWVQLRAAGRGPYVLRVERLGYRTFASDTFPLDSVVVRTIRLPAEAIHLPEITAQGRRRCGGVTDLAAEAAVLWDEVRKALSVSAWTAAEGSVFYVVREYTRRLELRTFKVLEERSNQQTVWTTGSPFVSLGARDLSEGGFIRVGADGGYQYYGPDSEVILSEWFQERHCFRAVANGSDPALIGLAFDPGPGAPHFDIKGVLWLDRRTAELRTLEYSYSALPVNVERRAAGGEVRFERLGSGRWIVRSWWIRAPVLQRAGTREPLVAAIREAGRTVVSLTERRPGADR